MPKAWRCRSRVNKENGRAAQTGEGFKGLDLFAATDGQSGFGLEEKGDVRAERGGEGLKLSGVERLAEEFVQTEQSGGGIAAAAAEASGHGDFLFKMEADAIGNFCFGQEIGGGAKDEVAGVDRKFGMATGELHARTAAREGDLVADVHRVHHGFQFVKSVGAFAEDVQDEVDLAGR